MAWMSYHDFVRDMGIKPNGMTLDRADNGAGYSPENCHWVTMKENTRNRSSNNVITFRGKSQCLAAWAEETGIKERCIWMRLYARKWTIEKTLSTPVRKRTI